MGYTQAAPWGTEDPFAGQDQGDSLSDYKTSTRLKPAMSIDGSL